MSLAKVEVVWRWALAVVAPLLTWLGASRGGSWLTRGLMQTLHKEHVMTEFWAL